MAGDNDSSRLLDSGGALVSRGLAHGQGLREVATTGAVTLRLLFGELFRQHFLNLE
jgi:hypothetical protein